MIIFEDVCFSYGDRSVIKHASFEVKDKEKLAILGESGEGKTTILKLIMGLIRPDTGRIIIDGEYINDKKESELANIRKRFSIVFQESALFDSLDVKENVAFCLREYTKMTEEQIEMRVKELLNMVGIGHAIGLMTDELSGGMKRRVAIARAFAAYKPKMFLYDEPTAGLDPVNSDNIYNLIIGLSKQGMGYVVVTHKLVDALKLADKFMFLKNGYIIFDDNKEVFLNSQDKHIQIFMNEINFTSDLIVRRM